jgi:hypothetical protein
MNDRSVPHRSLRPGAVEKDVTASLATRAKKCDIAPFWQCMLELFERGGSYG